MNETHEFQRAIDLVAQYVDFSRHANTVQVFESNIRVLGGLLSSHVLAKHVYAHEMVSNGFKYKDQLLELARDLGDRLLYAFNNTRTGLPFARVNLAYGVPENETNQTCAAGAGSLILEFGVLSRLTGDSKYETVAKHALKKLWSLRSQIDLIGNVIDIQTGQVFHV